MKNCRGFTVIEMMVGSIVLLLVVGIAMSFFIFQSRYGGQLMKDTGVRENVSAALMMIKRDIMHAGSGLDKQPELSLSMRDLFNTSGIACYRQLFISYGGYLGTMAPTNPNANYTTNTNVYSVYGKKSDMNGAIFTGEKTAVTAFTIAAMPNDILGVLTYNGTATPKVGFTPYTVTPVENTPASAKYAPKYQFTISNTSVPFTPGICYELVPRNSPGPDAISIPTVAEPLAGDASGQIAELRRNGVTILGGSRDKQMQITLPTATNPGGFRIRCQFIDSGGNETWVPTTSGATFDGQTFTNLRMVEVQIRYRTLRKNYHVNSSPALLEAWTPEITTTINVSPRELVLATYK